MTAAIPKHTRERVSIPVEDLRLEGVLTYPDTATGDDLAVLVNPHPCLGGDMENNVIVALEAEALRHGLVTLRFNYRGVGGSEGTESLEERIAAFWEDPSIDPNRETGCVDLRAALDFAIEAVDQRPRQLLLLGYSFGAVVAMLEVSRRGDITGLAMISPPVHQLVGSSPVPTGCPVVVTRGGEDIGVEDLAHGALIEHLGNRVIAFAYPETDHFYRDLEERLARDVIASLMRSTPR